MEKKLSRHSFKVEFSERYRVVLLNFGLRKQSLYDCSGEQSYVEYNVYKGVCEDGTLYEV